MSRGLSHRGSRSHASRTERQLFRKGNPNDKTREPRELHNVIGKVGPREGEENFPQLLRAIDQDPRCAALKRIRFTSSHPLDFSDELIECYAPAIARAASRAWPRICIFPFRADRIAFFRRWDAIIRSKTILLRWIGFAS